MSVSVSVSVSVCWVCMAMLFFRTLLQDQFKESVAAPSVKDKSTDVSDPDNYEEICWCSSLTTLHGLKGVDTGRFSLLLFYYSYYCNCGKRQSFCPNRLSGRACPLHPSTAMGYTALLVSLISKFPECILLHHLVIS